MVGSRRTVQITLLGTALALSLPVAALAAGPNDLPTHQGRQSVEGRQADQLPDRLKEIRGVPLSKLGTDVLTAKGRIPVFVVLKERAAADAYSARLSSGRTAARNAALAARRDVRQTADRVVADVRQRDGAPQVLYRTTNAVAGVAMLADADSLRQVASRPDVVSIARLVPKRLENASAAILTRVVNSWKSVGVLGSNMDIGVIDSGVDYTHANFGGPGTPEAYDDIDPTAVDPSFFPTAKVVGGWDFAGENYNADSDVEEEAVPQPDKNPLDCDGHGSHVAGTATGLGVTGAGDTFTGNYRTLTQSAVRSMRIGPGMAPAARLWAFKVFGCPEGGAGSTNLVAAALDATLDPNGDGSFSDHLDVVNISIGADYTTPDDPDTMVARHVLEHGVMPVFSAGNGGDFYDIGSEAPEALSVASTRDAFVLRDAIEVTAPPAVAGQKAGQYSVGLDYTGVDVTDDVANLTEADNLDGCDPLSVEDAARVNGKIAWLEWDDNDATRRCGSVQRSGNVVAAGATGALFTSELQHFTAGITGSDVVPVFQMTGAVTDQLRPSMEAGTLVVRMAGELAASLETSDPAIEDTPSSFTSRGTRSPGVKPDIAAPGDTIVSTLMGSGNRAFSNSGTSMASPHVAGIATLVRQAHRGWQPWEIKAALMNTANHDVRANEGPSGPILAPNRIGAGRVDAKQALTTKVIAFDKRRPALVSLGFGVVEVSKPVSITRPIRLVNKGNKAVTYRVNYRELTTIPGVRYEVNKTTVTVPGRGVGLVKVTLRIKNPAALRKTIDPSMNKIHLGVARQFLADASGRVQFRPVKGSKVRLRVPVYSAPKPVAAITTPSSVTLTGDTGTLTLGGKGLDQGSGDRRYRSLVSVMELAASDARLPSCTATITDGCAINGTARGGDIRYVGVSSAGGMLGFGIATWDNWANIGSNTIPFVDIDITGNADADYEVFLIRDVDTDLLEAWTVDLDAQELVDIQPVNQLYGDVDTNVFDTNVITLPVSLAALGVDPQDNSARFDYFVGVAGYYTAPDSSLVDFVPEILTFDPLQPGLSADQGGALISPAQPGTSFTIHRDAEELETDGSDSLLVLNYHNRTGQKASVVTVE